MKISIVLFFLFLTGCASNAEWTTTDTKYEVAYQLVAAMDAYTTMQIRHNPDPVIIERSWPTRQLIGSNPNERDVALLFVTYGISHYLIARALPPKWRRYFQVGTIGLSSITVINNCRNKLC